MSDPVISVEGLGKRYRIAHQANGQRYTALRDVLADTAKGLFGRLNGKGKAASGNGQARTASPFPLPASPLPLPPSSEDFWALKDVSFEVKQGEVLGIIGRNGAGKSTLLKVLSRITEPTEGRVRIKGRVASLLEVGTGFHPELTGRENIFLNGAVLGMTRAEIKKKFDEIVAFAEVEKFLDTPVKRYSSGMYVRLAFAVAAHLEPEILVVDEVLAVGDAEFQRKCLGKMGEVSQGGRTVLFVSHNMAALQALSPNAIYLQSGTIRAIGKADLLVNQYLSDAGRGEKRLLTAPVSLGNELTLHRFDFNPNPAANGSVVRFTIEFYAEYATRVTNLAVLFYSVQGVRVAILDLRTCGLPASLQAGHQWRVEGEINPLPFVEGDYRAGLYVDAATFNGDLLDLATISITARDSNGHIPYPAMYRGVVELDYAARLMSFRKLRVGLC